MIMKTSDLLIFLCLALWCFQVARAQDGSCSETKLCAPGYCCSKYGYCGQTDAYCSPDNCKYQCPGPSPPPPPPAPPAPPTPPPVPGSGKIAIYWGQFGDEPTLAETCNTGNYDIIMIAFVIDFHPLNLFLASCKDPPSGGCIALGPDIDACHEKGVKLLLSLGGAAGTYHLNDKDDAQRVAADLFNNFLGGNSSSRPFGPAKLDGIDLDIEYLITPDLYAELAMELRKLDPNVIISAAPQCPIPDVYIGSALKIDGLFDYIWVQFYNNPPCMYKSDVGAADLLASWDNWVKKEVSASSKIFVGLPAATEAAPSGGYIEPDKFISEVLPHASLSPKYGGVMLWAVYFDLQTKYSSKIRPYVLTSPAARPRNILTYASTDPGDAENKKT